MAQAGTTVENPVTGERCKWHLTAADTGGRLVRAELSTRPGGGVAAVEHVHRRSEERFELLAGRLCLEIAGQRRTLTAGDRAVVPVGVPHRWWNDGDDEVRFLCELEPPLRFEELLEITFRLAREGKVDRHGRPRPLALALLVREYEDELSVTSPPLWIQRLAFGALAAIARVVGVRLPDAGPALPARAGVEP